jgi:indole-3-glycerol phosphate synthase
VQASPVWIPPTGTLGGIVAEARERVAALRAREAELARLAADASGPPCFSSALRLANVAVIAEVKRRSPSKGWINPEIRAVHQAQAYEAGGAAAISVLTEPKHFGGEPADVIAIRDGVRLPVLKKDFHVDPIQLLEAKAIGASAALLIVRALSPRAFRDMVAAANELALELLVEVRDESELSRALEAGVSVIGINNRNLETLVIDAATCERLLGAIPASVVAVAESGIADRADVERLARAGADAVLIGSAVSAAPDPASAVKDLSTVPRVGRER